MGLVLGCVCGCTWAPLGSGSELPGPSLGPALPRTCLESPLNPPCRPLGLQLCIVAMGKPLKMSPGSREAAGLSGYSIGPALAWSLGQRGLLQEGEGSGWVQRLIPVGQQLLRETRGLSAGLDASLSPQPRACGCWIRMDKPEGEGELGQ